ncbi:hypothetical protein O1611_g7873 [Lasiodiplodia mahajangana]|uniref:Uncharacterized protein n=1 Tax=Lasiodiplodia mahajangana TaxID=1108764 RepID=A0ACC2JE73_9PEZI|nr:hypothetical protein O1611_g7873 [Lasiodiplodia mahajangana]
MPCGKRVTTYTTKPREHTYRPSVTVSADSSQRHCPSCRWRSTTIPLRTPSRQAPDLLVDAELTIVSAPIVQEQATDVYRIYHYRFEHNGVKEGHATAGLEQDIANVVRSLQIVVPYQEPPVGKSGDTPEFSSTLSSTMPMAAIFTRNRYIGWAAVVFSMQSWLGESEATTQSTSTPGYFSVGMSIMALLVTYLPIFMPPVPGQAQPTAAPAA